MIAITAKEVLIEGSLRSNIAITVDQNRITGVVETGSLPGPIPLIDLGDVALLSGFFDIQVNGGAGYLFNHSPTVDAIRDVATSLRSLGTTAFLPTLITDDLSNVERMAQAVQTALKSNIPGVHGVHFEGPFLNPDRKGVHNADYMAQGEKEFLSILDKYDLGAVLVTLAPERVSGSFISELISRKIIVSAGHTTADYDQAVAAINKGLTGFTHLYNAMPPMLSREPGIVGAALAPGATFSGLIADGHHIHPGTLKVAIKALGIDRAILVSDAMPCVGSDITHFKLGELNVTIQEGKCITADGTLAGSAISLADAVRYCREQLQLPIEAVITMASLTPARFMGLDQLIGNISVGKVADLITLGAAGQFKPVDLTTY